MAAGNDHPATNPRPSTEAQPPWVALSVLAGAWFLFTCWFSHQRWIHWDIGIDTAFYCQNAHQWLSGRGWQYTCYLDLAGTFARSLWAGHFYLFMWPMALLYGLLPHPLLFYMMKHLAHAAGGLFIGLIAFRILRDRPVAIMAALLYYLYPPHISVQMLDDVNFRHATLGLLPAVALAHLTGYRKTALICLALIPAGDETLGPLAGFYAFTLALEDPPWRRAWLATGIGCLVYTVLVVKIGLPAFLLDGVPIHFAARYAHLWTGPRAWWDVVVRPESLIYLVKLAGPLAFLPLAVPLSPWLLGAVPTVTQNLLSLNWDDVQAIDRHYTTPLAGILFLAMLFVLPRLELRLVRRGLVFLLLVNALLGCTIFPSLSYLLDGMPTRTLEIGRHFAPLAGLIPPEASLSAHPSVCARFPHRPKLWYFPQGCLEADWVVAEKFLCWYPPISETELAEYHRRLAADPTLELVLENPDVRVFRRRTGAARSVR